MCSVMAGTPESHRSSIDRALFQGHRALCGLGLLRPFLIVSGEAAEAKATLGSPQDHVCFLGRMPHSLLVSMKSPVVLSGVADRFFCFFTLLPPWGTWESL